MAGTTAAAALAGVAAGAPDADHASDAFARGKAIYNARCYFCHGYAGDAKTLAATYLDPPPTDFTATPAAKLDRAKMLATVTSGRSGTAMMGFATLLTAEEIALVVDFVRDGFMRGAAVGSYYHTPENGWDNHERYRAAFPFALGELPIDTPGEQLTAAQRVGLRLFLSTCITCHDRARVADDGPLWDPRAVSYPRGGFSFRQPVDAVSGATTYARHDVAPVIDDLSDEERRGEALFQANCAFCHAADGTGRNWIGSFLDPHPRDLTDAAAMAGMTRERLVTVIRDGLPGTTMSAWRTVLDAGEIAAIAGYIQRAFQPPAAEPAGAGGGQLTR